MTIDFIQDAKLPEDFEPLPALSIGGNDITIPSGDTELTNQQFRQLRIALSRIRTRHVTLKTQIENRKTELRTIERYARAIRERLEIHTDKQGERIDGE